MRIAQRRQSQRFNLATEPRRSALDDSADADFLRHPATPGTFRGASDDGESPGTRRVRMVRRTAMCALAAIVILAAITTVSGQTMDACQTRSTPIGVAIEETTVHGESNSFLGLLAFFGGAVGESESAPMHLTVASDKYGCEPISQATGKAVLVWRGECTFGEKAAAVEAAGGAAMIVVTDEAELTPMSCVGNATVTIPVMQVLAQDGDQLKSGAANGASVTFKELKLKGSVDLVASFALLAMASLTIVFGAMWSLSDQGFLFKPKSDDDMSQSSGGGGREASGGGIEGLEITEMSAAYFVVFASIVLLVIFFTMQHWVFLIIKGVFCFAAVQGLHALFIAVFESGFKALSKDIDLPVFGTVNQLSVPSVACAVVVVLVWLLNQEATWAWVLQDVMGMSFLGNVLRLVHLPNLKVGTLLLIGAMCYDIFWVYIQPHLFGKESVMVKVAKGGEQHESLPMLFLFPRLGGNVGDYSMLGYGDVILPGLLIVHNHLFDNRYNESSRARLAYLLPSIVAYVAGLLLTFLALHLQIGGQGGQPALCYLVPTVLGGTVAYAHCRGDLKEMWAGSTQDDGLEADGEGERLIGTGSTNSSAV